jgi:uncharacterized membrane protein YgcG
MVWTPRFLLLAIVAGWAVDPAAVHASEPKVNDRAEFFSKPAIEKATQKLQDIKDRFKVDVVIETFPSIPEGMAAEFKSQTNELFFKHWAQTSANEEGFKGIYVLICKDPGYFQIEPVESVDENTISSHQYYLLINSARRLLGENRNDAALMQVTNTIESDLANNLGQGPAPVPAQKTTELGGEAPWQAYMRWLSIAAGILLGIWLLKGLVSAFRAGYGGISDGGYGSGGIGPWNGSPARGSNETSTGGDSSAHKP